MMQEVKGFRVEYQTIIEAPREDVFDAMLELDQWFPHRFIEGSPIAQEPGMLGRGYEDWGNGEGALYSVTTMMKRPAVWTVLNAPGVFGMYISISTHKFETVPEGTRVSVSLFAMGDVTEENQQMFENGYPGIYDELRKYVARRG